VLEVQSNDSKSEEGSKKYAAQVTEWMHEVGIPSEEQDEKYVVLSESELEELALQGDTIANIWLGLKRASSGDEDSAVAILQDAVVDGSIGAALTLANLYSGTTTPSFEANVLEAYAWFRVAQVMGDSNAMFMMFGGPDFTMEEYFLAEQNYFLLLTELQRDHQAQYGTPLPFNPRPTEETSNDP
jgi:TPR repeat protein